MKVLFISYYFDPFPGVGAKRMSYWVNNISKHGIEPTVITAIEQTSENENIIYLPRSNKTKFLSKIIRDEGVNWELDLISYFKLNKESFNYDCVIISGGPFMHFGISKFLKHNFGVKSIIDYRDPFANNPRHNDSMIKKRVKYYFENIFNKYAEFIIAVNIECKKGLSYPEKVNVINNGYDDNYINSGLESNTEFEKGLIINGGKFYNDCSEDKLLNVIRMDNKLSFLQVGAFNLKIDNLADTSIKSIGFVPYDELVKYLLKAEITTVLTSGKWFETPTKMYDYIALNKKILIITEGKIKQGEIHEMTKDYPNVVWSKNNEKDIKQAILKLQQMQVVPFDSYKFSRAYGLEKLVKLLNTL